MRLAFLSTIVGGVPGELIVGILRQSGNNNLAACCDWCEDAAVPNSKLCLTCDGLFDSRADVCPVDDQPLIQLEDPDARLGSILSNRYSIEEMISVSKRSVVYKGVYIELAKPVAIKFLRTYSKTADVALARLTQGALANASVNDDAIVTLFDTGLSDRSEPYLVMEYVPGRTLKNLLSEKGVLTVPQAIPLFVDIAKAVGYCHYRGVVHRNLTPENILINDDGSIKLLDFNLVKLMPWSGCESLHLTATGEFVGEVTYASPEQCTGKKIEPSSDIYSLGIVLCEALTGRPPFTAKSPGEICQHHIQARVPAFSSLNSNVEVPESLEKMIKEKCLHKDPVRRFLNMNEFQLALRSTYEDAASLPPHEPPRYEEREQNERLESNASSNSVAQWFQEFKQRFLRKKDH